MLVAAAAWGTSGTAQAVADIGTPIVVGATRTVSGAIALWVAAAVVARRHVPASRRQEVAGTTSRWRPALVVAGLGVTVSQMAFFAAVDITGVAVGTVVAIGSTPIVAGLLQAVAARSMPSRGWWLATALAVTGVALVLLVGADGPAVDATGIALAVLAGSAYGVVTVASGRVMGEGVRATAAMARVFVVGAVPAAVVLVVQDTGPLVSTRGLLLVLWLAIVTVAVPYLLFASGLRTLAPATVGTLTLAEPLVAAAIGVWFLGERPGPWSVAGALLLVVGLVLAARDGLSPRPQGRAVDVSAVGDPPPQR